MQPREKCLISEGGLQCCVRLQTLGKGTDELFHGRMAETVETEVIHLFERTVQSPVFESDTIRGNKNTRAILAKFK